jgi:hypothetical protein
MIDSVEVYRDVEIVCYDSNGPLPPYGITGGWWLAGESTPQAAERIITAVISVNPDNSIVDDCETSQMFFNFVSVKDARVAIDVLHATGRIAPADVPSFGDLTVWLADTANCIRETLTAVGDADDATGNWLRGLLAALTIAADVAEAVRADATSDEQSVRILTAVVVANAAMTVSADERAGWRLIAQQMNLSDV